jgi:hypothetical protein
VTARNRRNVLDLFANLNDPFKPEKAATIFGHLGPKGFNTPPAKFVENAGGSHQNNLVKPAGTHPAQNVFCSICLDGPVVHMDVDLRGKNSPKFPHFPAIGMVTGQPQNFGGFFYHPSSIWSTIAPT